MSAPRRAIWLACSGLGLLLLGALIPAHAVRSPEAGSSPYEIRLPEFDLYHYRSAAIDADRRAAEETLSRDLGGSWAVHAWNPQSGTPAETYGEGVDIAGPLSSSADVRAAAERIIASNAGAFRADMAGLRFVEAAHMPAVSDAPDGVLRVGKWAAHFQQVYRGIDVVGGRVHMVFTDGGRIFALGSTFYSGISIDSLPSIPAATAAEIARHGLALEPGTDPAESDAQLLILPIPKTETRVVFRLIWRIRMRTQMPPGIWRTDVDARSGEIVQRIDEICFADYFGTAAADIERWPWCDGWSERSLPYIRVNIEGVGTTYADAQGNWRIAHAGSEPGLLNVGFYGQYVEVHAWVGSDANITTTIPAGVSYKIKFDETNSLPCEADVYRTVGDVHDLFETIAPGFGYTNARIVANVNVSGSGWYACNAWYDILHNTINFAMRGTGCQNAGMILDIIAHEYGHGVQQAILGEQGDEGLGEGNSDVLGFLITMDSLIGRGLFMDCAAGLRDCNNTLRYPEDVIDHEVHDAGRVIAGFHWDAMEDMIARYGSWGRRGMATDWHWGRVLIHPLDQPAQVFATFVANDDDGNMMNGTPQFESYALAATNHGFDVPDERSLQPEACGTYSLSPQGFRMDQQNVYWTAVAVNPSTGDDKDIAVYANGGDTQLANSTGTDGTDFVVGDFNHTALGSYQPYVSYGAGNATYVVEWDSGADLITPGTDVSGSVGGGSGSCGLVRAWDVFLTAGRKYRFYLHKTGGAADIRVSLFRNPTTSAYWAGRSSAIFELQAGVGYEYTAPATDYYGIVVFNNSPGSLSAGYVLRVQDPPVALASGVCQSASASPRMFSFSQTQMFWTGVAVNPSGNDDKDLYVFDQPDGFDGVLANSTSMTGTDFVVGDFNHNTTATYYAQPSFGDASASYVMEWNDDADAIQIGTDINGSVGGASGGCGLIKVRDVYLTQGRSYRFLILTNGSADIRMSLFRNPSSATFWAGRSAAEFEVGNADGRTYAAPESDWYGVVVFNNAPGSPAGSYTLRVRDVPAPLISAACVTGNSVPLMYSFTQLEPYWACVGVEPGVGDDKDISLYADPDGLGTMLATSAGAQGADFVVGDFNHMAASTYYAMVSFGGLTTAYVAEWDDGPDVLYRGEDASGSVGGGNGDCGVVRIWDLSQQAGRQYRVTLTKSGDADIRVALFRNPANAPYWSGRSAAVFEKTAAQTPFTYTAAATDYCGLVVFNNSQGSAAGAYTVRVDDASALPDLIAESVEIQPANPTINDPVQVRALVKNQGNVAAPASTTRFFLDGVVKGDKPSPALAVGQQAWTDWLPLGTLTAGQHEAQACADGLNQIAELVEENNCRAISFAVSGSSSVEDGAEMAPGIWLPNPYNVGASILVHGAPASRTIDLMIYNVQGQVVRRLVCASSGGTARTTSWDGVSDAGARLGPGVYFLRAALGETPMTRTLLLVR